MKISYHPIGYTTEDKLVAVRDIAQDVAEALDDELVARLWRNRILEELCWRRHLFKNETLPTRPLKWRAPTWSWASTNGKVWVSNTSKFHGCCEHKQIWVELVDLDIKTKPSGELVHGHASMRIRCKLIPASIKQSDMKGNILRRDLTFANTKQNLSIALERGGAYTTITVDVPDDTDEQPRNVHLIIIQRCPHEGPYNDDEDDKHDCAEGLLLVPHHKNRNVFERLGYFYVRDDHVESVVQPHEAAESSIITLV
ncbi:uncharacterized protein BDZ99DRAFT_171289 [Mytilinidion resinicola]|uniref:Uncharacterized protein n=1 Tax=Mytilinidion resinicola TaxID=574789 RepID=A0A6A6Y5Q3_9PEZI|nr:uncharacterized protein BDZ99DRAFT_171289 [Mytilinidion resinicola]KAF2803354.1 hypothetical protein BDZ99DRAFT_171289 [Mytilinidion resinicola]